MQSIDETRNIFAIYGNIMRTEELTANKIHYRNVQSLLDFEVLKSGGYLL